MILNLYRSTMKKIFKYCLFGALLFSLVGITACGGLTKKKVDDKCICVETPERPNGQQDVIGLTCDPIDTVRIVLLALEPEERKLSVALLIRNTFR